MFKIFFLLFLLVPLVELYVLIEVGAIIGALPTILLTIITAIVGAALMRHQGVSTMQKAQLNMAQGQVPAVEMMEGVFIFLGGLMLLIPGLITDAMGFMLLIPPIRQLLAKKLIAQRQAQYAQYKGHVYETEWTEHSSDGRSIQHVRIIESSTPDKESDVIEGEVLDDDNKPNR
ncbi:MAG: FxsA family protein [Hydrogenovibrio crunogenus]|nr:FxsA family protein [Hydrogenovibrio crunogenus]